jgi:hypothetical protein
MRVVYLRWTYEELERPMAGREDGHPITMVSPKPIAYDASTQAHLDIDEAVNAELCADLLARTGAYWVDAEGDLAIDPDWSEEI